MCYKPTNWYHIRLYEPYASFHILWSDLCIFWIHRYGYPPSVRSWSNMDFPSILDCFYIRVILAKILQCLPEIAPHFGPIHCTTWMLRCFYRFLSGVGLSMIIILRLLVISCTLKLIFFLKEVVRTNGSLPLLRLRSTIILSILYISTSFLVWSGLLVANLDMMLI